MIALRAYRLFDKVGLSVGKRDLAICLQILAISDELIVLMILEVVVGLPLLFLQQWKRRSAIVRSLLRRNFHICTMQFHLR